MREILTYGGYFEAFIVCFFIFDKGNIVVLFNGFQKKMQKTPKTEIEIAKRIKKEYYESQERRTDKEL